MNGQKIKVGSQQGVIMDKVRTNGSDKYLVKLDNSKLVLVDVDNIELLESNNTGVLHG